MVCVPAREESRARPSGDKSQLLPIWVLSRDILGYYSGSVGIMEKKMETTIMGSELYSLNSLTYRGLYREVV